MHKLVRNLLSTIYGIISIVSISATAAQAQPSGSPQNGPPGQPSDFQNPPGGPVPSGLVPPLESFSGHNGSSTSADQSTQVGDFYPPRRKPWGGDKQGPGTGQDQGPGQGNFSPGRQGQWAGAQELTPEQKEQRRQRMMQKFDKNGDGQLDENERAQMRALMQKRHQERMQQLQQQGQGGGPAGNFGGGPRGGGPGGGGQPQ